MQDGPAPTQVTIRSAPRTIDGVDAWNLVRQLLAAGTPDGRAGPLALAKDGGWQCAGKYTPEAESVFEIFLPLVAARASTRRTMVVALLGQSLDGRIATLSGHSHYVNCEAALLHLHRVRALADAVIVGAGTVALDDPQLTVRRCEGTTRLRVVVDPDARAPAGRKVFTDGRAPTLLARCQPGDAIDGAETVLIPRKDEAMDLDALLDVLYARGVRLALVEGGGRTVSHFMTSGRVDRLQLAVAPMVIGSGRPSIALPPIDRLDDALRPPTRRFALGADTLFECRLGD
jgi:diaminohydroxyphosphoribosylaminopyrimidine deaminase / 5-amino-6-(5-phosphoribosylamino)uracil reductase